MALAPVQAQQKYVCHSVQNMVPKVWPDWYSIRYDDPSPPEFPPPAAAPVHSASIFTVDTPTSPPPASSSLYSESPLTHSTLHPILQNLVHFVMEKVDWIVENAFGEGDLDWR
ncbi:hypothetical protein BDR03DRAFT_1018384 [Suillus americanus]|nr:hypothetical protein BDR03DRAFT_1018384 [Suillus americanus]